MTATSNPHLMDVLRTHGHAMGFQYNGKLRSTELLLRADGTVVCIRRAETLANYFATLDHPGLSTVIL